MTLYFAYGSNMDAGQMRLRCPHSGPAGGARLAGWRFRINEQGWATVVPEAGAEVLGCLWQLTPADEQVLDDYEGFGELPVPLYTKVRLPVETTDGRTESAMVYLATVSTPGKPVSRYLDPILRAAAERGFPESYLAELRSWRASG